MDVDELLARELIRDTIARYAHCGDGGRFDEMVQLFSADGVLEVDGREPLRGRDAILAFLKETKTTLAERAAGARPFIRHHVNSVRIDVLDATTAAASSYFFAITQRGPDHWGRYRDRLVRQDERWLFAHRRVRLDGRSASF